MKVGRLYRSLSQRLLPEWRQTWCRRIQLLVVQRGRPVWKSYNMFIIPIFCFFIQDRRRLFSFQVQLAHYSRNRFGLALAMTSTTRALSDIHIEDMSRGTTSTGAATSIKYSPSLPNSHRSDPSKPLIVLSMPSTRRAGISSSQLSVFGIIERR